MYSAARRAAEAEPLNAAAQNVGGLVAEDRGDLPSAATAFHAAATLAAAPRGEGCCCAPSCMYSQTSMNEYATSIHLEKWMEFCYGTVIHH